MCSYAWSYYQREKQLWRRVALSKIDKRILLVKTSFISKSLFYNSCFIVQFRIRNNTNAMTLIDINEIEYDFNEEIFVVILYQTLEIESQCFLKPKRIQRFCNEAIWPMNHCNYLLLSVGNDTKTVTIFVIVKSSDHFLFLCVYV